MSSDDELRIKRELQLLKGDDGQYVLTSLGSMYALPKLVEYIAAQRQQWLQEAVGVLPEKVKPKRKSDISETMTASGFNWAIDQATAALQALADKGVR